MPYRIEIAPDAVRYLQSLPLKPRRQIARKIDALGSNPHPHGCRKLHAGPDLWRIRSGDYRIIYTVEHERIRVLVLKIGDRKDIYRCLPQIPRPPD